VYQTRERVRSLSKSLEGLVGGEVVQELPQILDEG
jgi:hypothetical protein